MNVFLLILFGLFFLSGCTALGITEQKTARIQSVGENDTPGTEIVSFPTQLRAAYVNKIATKPKPNPNQTIICAEPFADVAVSTSLETSIDALNKAIGELNNSQADGSVNNATTDVSQSIKTALKAVNDVVALDGRSPEGLALIHFLYRVCEAYANGAYGSGSTIDTVKTLHSSAIGALENIFSAKNALAQATLVKEKKEKLEVIQKLDPRLLGAIPDGG